MTKGPSTISAAKPYSRNRNYAGGNRRERGGENVHWKRIVAGGDELNKALRVSGELQSTITRLVLFKHLSPIEGEAAKRYAYIMARHDRYFVQGARASRSQSYERAFGGEDQEIERRNQDGTIADYERTAKKAKKHYLKLQIILDRFADPITGRNIAKDVLDDLCCSDVEPATALRESCAAVLKVIAHEFGVQPKRAIRSTAKKRRRK